MHTFTTDCTAEKVEQEMHNLKIENEDTNLQTAHKDVNIQPAVNVIQHIPANVPPVQTQKKRHLDPTVN